LSVMKFGVLLTKRGFIVNLIFSFVYFELYYVFSYYVLQHVVQSTGNGLIVQASFSFTVAITLLATSFFINRFNKLRAIYACSLAISIVAVLLLFSSIVIFRLALIFVIAILFGIGQLTFFTYFWNLTMPEERGRIAGLIGFVVLPLYLIVETAVAETLDFPRAVMLGIILSLGALVVVVLRPNTAMLTAKKDKRGNHYEKRTAILYAIPWIIFSLNNMTLARSISLNILQQVSSSFYVFLTVLQVIGTIFGALCGGMIADFFGRRLSLAFSLTLYGISSALAGLFMNEAVLSFVYIANGLSWGILLTLYTFVIWGDLANKENCARIYSIGLVIYYLTMGIGLLPTQVFQIPLVISALASCLLIFLSNVPIILAPELLSSDFREKMKLKLHMNAIRKINKKLQNQG
jgi:hypothetical protein